MTSRGTCPSCKGEPTSPMFIRARPRSRSQVILLTCPYCGGTGLVVYGREGWAEIGDRLRRSRQNDLVGVVTQHGRRVLTLDRDVPLEPFPLEIRAKQYDIPVEMLVAIENGLMDPQPIADKVDKVDPECLRDRARQLALPW